MNSATWDSNWIAAWISTQASSSLKGTIFETPANLYWCYENEYDCAFNAASYLTYQAPKSAAEAAGKAAFWAGKKLLSVSDWLVNEGCKHAGHTSIDLYGKVAKHYHIAAEKANMLVVHATNLALPKAATLTKEAAETSQAFDGPQAEAFNIVHLIGPAALFAFATHKATNNAWGASNHLWLLLSGRRILTTNYPITATTSTMSKDMPVCAWHTRRYTSLGLIKDTAMEAAFAAFWGATSYFSYQGILNAVTAAGGDAARAQMITRCVVTAAAAAPILYTIIKSAMHSVSSAESPTQAPQLAYTDGNSGTALLNRSISGQLSRASSHDLLGQGAGLDTLSSQNLLEQALG